jgi:DNA-directed RNA polymerase
MRVKESPEQLVHLRQAYQRGQLDDVLAALDVLGTTQWRINKRVRRHSICIFMCMSVCVCVRASVE